MITGSLVELLYEPASIQRWNDHMRPGQGFTELDKQAQKMVFAYVLGKFQEETGATINWSEIIEAALFEFLHRIKLTDIKPPVFHKLMSKKGHQINEWVLKQYENEPWLDDDLRKRFEDYLFSDTETLERRIVKASHYLATKWEFSIVYRLNIGSYGLEKDKEQIDRQLEEHVDLRGVQKVMASKPIQDLTDLISQLRFQQRWGQTPRVPQTSVLGHSLIVAILSYFCSLQIGACPKRVYNNYFCGLFHDLPEVLTRDIVAPVKRAVEGLDEIIKDIEAEEVSNALYPLLPENWHDEIRYFIEDEFSDRIMVGGKRHNIDQSTEKIGDYNQDVFSPLDGRLLKVCDQLAAYSEAFLSIEHGIKSRHLKEAVNSIYRRYCDFRIQGIDMGEVFRYFDPNSLA